MARDTFCASRNLFQSLTQPIRSPFRLMVKRGPPLGMRVGGHRWPLSAIMLTVAGRRGRRVGGELSWGGLEGGEREATRALSLAALGSEAAQ